MSRLEGGVPGKAMPSGGCSTHPYSPLSNSRDSQVLHGLCPHLVSRVPLLLSAIRQVGVSHTAMWVS